MTTYGLVINPGAGSNLGIAAEHLREQVADALAATGTIGASEIAEGADLESAFLHMAKRPDIDVVVAVGGDGTVSQGAAVCVEAGKPYFPLPFGTFNLFCRSVGHRDSGPAALAGLARLRTTDVRLGVVNGRVFVHHVSGGLQPRYVRLRDMIPYKSRLGKLLAGLRAWFRTLRTLPRHRVIIDTSDGKRLHKRLAGYAITIAPVVEEIAAPPLLALESQGKLIFHMTPVSTRRDAIYLTLHLLLGRWRQSRLMETIEDCAFAVRVGRRNRLTVSVDGERVRLDLPLQIDLHPKVLRVLGPA